MEEEIGKRLLEVRTKKNFTQEYLAERIGTVPSYISNMERKNKYPSLTLLRKIVKELDTSFDYLLMNDFEIDERIEIKYKEMFKELKKLDYKTQQEFFNVAESLLISLKNIEESKK